MKNIFITALVLFLISAGNSQSISHQEIRQANEGDTVLIEALLEDVDPTTFSQLTLNYRPQGQHSYQAFPMQRIQENFYQAEFTISENGIPVYEYFLMLELNNGQSASFPSSDPATDPVRIKITLADTSEQDEPISDNSTAYFEPAPGSEISEDDGTLFISWFGRDDVTPESVQIVFNGKDVTSSATIRDNHLVYEPASYKPGVQSVKVQLGKAEPITWNYTVLRDSNSMDFKSRFKQNGSAAADMVNSSVDGQDVTVSNLYLRHSMHMNWISAKTKFKFSSLEDSNKQPKNRYLADLSFPYGSVRLGDVHPVLNEYALKGNRVRGMELKLDYSFLHLHYIKGQLKRTVQGFPLLNSMLIPDAQMSTALTDYQLTGDLIIPLDRNNYTFKRNLSAFNMGFGSVKSFLWNFNFIKAKDDIGSVDKIRSDARISLPENLVDLVTTPGLDFLDIDTTITDNFGVPDTVITWHSSYRNLEDNIVTIFGTDKNPSFDPFQDEWRGDKPQDNIVVGTDFIINFHHQRIQYRSGISFSMLNRDIWEPVLTKDELDTLHVSGVIEDDDLDGKIDGTMTIPFDPEKWENIFQMGLNQIPLLPIDISSGSIGLKELTHMPSIAYNMNLTLKYFGHVFDFGYRQVGPEFNSLANPYIRKNIRETTVSDRMKFLQNKLYLILKYTHSDDAINLSEETNLNANRYGINVSYYPGINLPTFNFAYQLETRKDGSADSTFTEGGETVGLSNRENTTQTQFNLSIMDAFDFYGRQTVVFSYFKADAVDNLLDDIDLDENPSYFSPESHNQAISMNVKTGLTKFWEIRSLINYNYYNFSKAIYYSSQSTSMLEVMLYRNLDPRSIIVNAGLNYSHGNGNASFGQFSILTGVVWEIIPEVKISANYELRSKSITDGDSFTNSFFNARINYNY